MTRKITVSYAIYDPDHEGEPSERGWTNEDGVEFESTLEAADWLLREGAVHPSSSDPVPNLWFDSEGYTDPRTGQVTESAFHLSGFSTRELETLLHVVRKMPQIGHPESLEFCWADDWKEFAKDLQIEDDVIVGSPDPSLVGMSTAAAYVERFAVDRQEEVEWRDGPDGTQCYVLGTNDAIFFNCFDRPVLARRVTNEGVSYSLETKSFLSDFEKAPAP
jgi:hypothetical protein